MNLLKFKLDKYYIHLINIDYNYNNLVINSQEKFSINFIYFKFFFIKFIYKACKKSNKIDIFVTIKNLLSIIHIVNSHENIYNILDQIIIILLSNKIFIQETISEEEKLYIYNHLKPINDIKIKFIYILLFHLKKISYFFISDMKQQFFKVDEKYENELLWIYDNL